MTNKCLIICFFIILGQCSIAQEFFYNKNPEFHFKDRYFNDLISNDEGYVQLNSIVFGQPGMPSDAITQILRLDRDFNLLELRVDSQYIVVQVFQYKNEECFLLENSIFNPNPGEKGFYYLNDDLQFELLKGFSTDTIDDSYYVISRIKKWKDEYWINYTSIDSGETKLFGFDEELNLKRIIRPDIGERIAYDFAFSDSLALLCSGDGLYFFDSNWQRQEFFPTPRDEYNNSAGDTTINYQEFQAVAYFDHKFYACIHSSLKHIISETPMEFGFDKQIGIFRFDNTEMLNRYFIGSRDTTEQRSFAEDILTVIDGTNLVFASEYYLGNELPMVLGVTSKLKHQYSYFKVNPEYDYQLTKVKVFKDKNEVVIAGNYYTCHNCEAGIIIIRFSLDHYQSILKHHQPDFEFTIHPNPAQDHVKISGLKKERNYHYVLYNASGKVIKQGQLLNTEMDVSQLSSGTYLLNLQAANGLSATKQLVVR